MGKWIIFGGTTEGRLLAQRAHDAGRDVLVCVTSEYARSLLDVGIPCRVGAMDEVQMLRFLETQQPERIIDATHPYAVRVSQSLRACAAQLGVPLERVRRDETHAAWQDAAEWVDDAQQAAEAADVPVILVGDINLGGVFASLLGTMMLLTDEERARVKGVIINKFRGDVKLLEPGLRMLEARIHVPVLGVVPWMVVELEDEDSVTERLARVSGMGDLDIAVVKLRHISNFTDFQALALQPGARVRYARTAAELESTDLIVLPGTKNTIEDLIDLRSRGMDAAIVRHAQKGGMVIGVCGGYQMLGRVLRDPDHVESHVPELAGLGLLDMEVTFEKEKYTAQASASVCAAQGWLSDAKGLTVVGYEIHAGQNHLGESAVPWLAIGGRIDGVMNESGNVLGSYLHGLFDDGQLFAAIAAHLRGKKGLASANAAPVNLEAFREREFDRIASIVRASMNMDAIYRILRGEA